MLLKNMLFTGNLLFFCFVCLFVIKTMEYAMKNKDHKIGIIWNH